VKSGDIVVVFFSNGVQDIFSNIVDKRFIGMPFTAIGKAVIHRPVITARDISVGVNEDIQRISRRIYMKFSASASSSLMVLGTRECNARLAMDHEIFMYELNNDTVILEGNYFDDGV
jgi:hypothetical protein